MKFRLLALVLALTMSMWAQTATQNPPPESTPSTPKAECPCCEKMAADSGPGCCHHEKGMGKNAAGCCGGKQGSGCCGKGMQCGKASAKNGGCCGGQSCNNAKGCCGKGCGGNAADGAQASMNCCKGKQCPRHRATEATSPGN